MSNINFGDRQLNSNPAADPSIGNNFAVDTIRPSNKNISLAKRIAMNHPSIVCKQNFIKNGENIMPIDGEYIHFPKTSYSNGKFNLDYSINDTYEYDAELRKSLNIDVDGQNDLFKRNNKSYNRFKLAMPDRTLEKGFVHIFLTRPDCNIISLTSDSLVDQCKYDPNMVYAYAHCPEIIRELQISSNNDGYNNEFNLLLSNLVQGFKLSDESLEYDVYGKSYQNTGITFGRNNMKSKANGEFSLTYMDDRDLHVYHMHKVWTDYINNVYRGRWCPRSKYMYEKVIDYACCLYYFLVAEDGETILFWSKYYGVFPVNIPSSSFSWDEGSIIQSPKLDISYQYSFKEDFNPFALVEFNANTIRGGDSLDEKISLLGTNTSYDYEKIYNENYGHSGTTWVGCPYVEFNPEIKTEDGEIRQAVYKLKFTRKY